jgi:hypothetical protein
VRRGRQTAKSRYIYAAACNFVVGGEDTCGFSPPASLRKADTQLKRVARIADYAFKAAALRGSQGEGPGSGDACGDGRSSRGVVATTRDGAGRREFGPRGSPMADEFRL